MKRDLYAEERRRQRRRDLKALTVLGIWCAGCGLLYLAWQARASFSAAHADAVGTAVYLLLFFYLFAFWPISLLVDRLVDRLFGRPAQEGGSPISGARSAAGTSRKAAGGESSSGAGS
jgi:hypothetical protein